MPKDNKSLASTFKRLVIGTNFRDTGGLDARLGTFRKVDGSHAYAILPNGRGQTHEKIKFARNRAVRLIS